jgi:hypothetical protein
VILQSHPSGAHDWVLVTAPGCLLALPSDDLARLDGLAARLSETDGFRAALELLLAGGIAGAPSFALVDGDSSVARVVLRGEASIEVTATDPDAAELTISGAGMATWSERVLEGARSLRLLVPGSTWTVGLESSAAPAPDVAPPPGVEPAAVTAEAATIESKSRRAKPPTRTVAEVTLVPNAEIELPLAESPRTESPVSVPDAEPYDFLFGDTIYRTQSGASIRIPNPDPERPGDHDGHTMLAEELGLAGHVPALAVFPVLPVPPEESGPAPLPTLQLERADGSRESLARPVLIGRAPSVPAATPSGSAPRLLTILDDKDISRSHIRVSVEGDAVVVTDLASKNGTVVTLPGGSPRKLRGGEPTVVLPGTLIDLGGGVTFTVRED